MKGHQKIESKIPGGIYRFALGFCKNIKKRTETLYQSFSPFMANPVDIDTVDDAPNRVQGLVHCTRIIEHVTKVAEIEASARMPS